MTRDNPDVAAVVRRHTTAELLWGHRTAQALGISPTEFATLNMISLEDDVTASDLSRITGLSPAAVTRMVDRLVDRGFVARRPNPADRRQTHLVRTAAWQAEIEATVEPRRQVMRDALAELPPEGRAAVIRWMAAETPLLRDIVVGDAPLDDGEVDGDATTG